MQPLPMFMDRTTLERRQIGRVSEEELKAQRLLSTGGQAKSFEEVDDIKGVIDNERELESMNIQRKGNQYTTERQKFQTHQIIRSHEVLSQFRMSLAQARSPNSATPQGFQNDIHNALQNLQNIMNDMFNGEYTLSGTALYDPAVTDLVALGSMGPVEAETENTSYYIGGDDGDIVYLDSTTTIDRATVNGQHPCFEKMIRALRLAQTADVTNTNDPIFTQVTELVDESNREFGIALNSVATIVESIRISDHALEQSMIQTEKVYEMRAFTDTNEAFEIWQTAKNRLEVSRSLSLFVSQTTAQFVNKILSQH